MLPLGTSSPAPFLLQGSDAIVGLSHLIEQVSGASAVSSLRQAPVEVIVVSSDVGPQDSVAREVSTTAY